MGRFGVSCFGFGVCQCLNRVVRFLPILHIICFLEIPGTEQETDFIICGGWRFSNRTKEDVF